LELAEAMHLAGCRTDSPVLHPVTPRPTNDPPNVGDRPLPLLATWRRGANAGQGCQCGAGAGCRTPAPLPHDVGPGQGGAERLPADAVPARSSSYPNGIDLTRIAEDRSMEVVASAATGGGGQRRRLARAKRRRASPQCVSVGRCACLTTLESGDPNARHTLPPSGGRPRNGEPCPPKEKVRRAGAGDTRDSTWSTRRDST
jgi:hypothetical protein